MSPPDVSGIVLAGGRGKRLGRDKAVLEFGGRPLLLRVTETLSALTDDIVVVRSRDRHLQLSLDSARIVSDIEPYRGVLAGIAAGLSAANNDYSLVVACDMPFLNVRLLHHIVSQARGYDVVVPRLQVGLEPLHALYRRRCLPELRRILRGGEKRIVSLYASVQVRYLASDEVDRLDPTRRSFFNINTPEDLREAKRLLRQVHDGP